jgi:hypothetical protein
MITALRHLSALMTLLAGVAAGLVDGVTAATTPTGPRNFDKTAFRVFGNDTYRPDALEVPQQSECLAEILGDLVVDIAEPGIPHRHLREVSVAARFHDGPPSSEDGFVDLLLSTLFKLTLRDASAAD